MGTGVLLPRLAGAHRSATQKAPGEVVTEADTAAETALTEGLRDLIAGAAIVGEESAHADPGLLDGLGAHEWSWVVDPLDGTRHFAAGEGPFGIIVALLRRGECEAGWIDLPQDDTLVSAWRGRGVRMNGAVLRTKTVTGRLRGGLLTRLFPEPLRTRTESATGLDRTDGRHHCAARRYIDLLTGAEHFAAYWRTLPWDHAAGVLMVEEAGGLARRFDGARYVAADVETTGLLVASDEHTWHEVRSRVLGTATESGPLPGG